MLSFAVAGWHPYAEDGGMYLTRVLLRVDSTLYPHYRDFIVEPLRTSLFEPLLADLVRLHVPLPWSLLALDIATLALTLTAGLALLRRITADQRAQLTGVALLATWATLPVAGTSLLLIDPYLTARSFCAPFALFAVALALDPAHPMDQLAPWRLQSTKRSAWLCALSLAVAFGFHPLMAAYALGLVIMLRLVRRPRAALSMTVTAGIALLAAIALQLTAGHASAAARAVDASRYYWFLSQWHGYELVGIAAPALILAAFATLRPSGFKPATALLARATLALLACALAVELCCAQEHFASHPVARLQPLRVLWIVYALLPLLLGAGAVLAAEAKASRQESAIARKTLRTLPFGLVLLSAAIFFVAQRATFPGSPHVEFPGRDNPNPWVQAFLWSRNHTPPDALFALDARYVNANGEDAQNFRAISLHSSLPDFSKDGGEAANQPSLAPLWLPAAEAQRDLSRLTPVQREERLRPFAPDWLVLSSSAQTAAPCPYDNGTVKVCRFRP